MYASKGISAEACKGKGKGYTAISASEGSWAIAKKKEKLVKSLQPNLS